MGVMKDIFYSRNNYSEVPPSLSLKKICTLGKDGYLDGVYFGDSYSYEEKDSKEKEDDR